MNNTGIHINSLYPFPFLSICHYINGIGLLLLENNSRSIDSQGQSIVVVNALFGYLNATENETNTKRVLLQKVLKGTDFYGGEHKETLDEQYVIDTYQYIISGTLFAQFGGIHGYLARIINMANDLKISSLKNDVFEDLSRKIVSVDCSIEGKDFREKMYHDDRGSKQDESSKKARDSNENEGSKQEHDNLKLTSLAVKKIIQDYLWVIFPEPEEDTSIFDVNYIYAMAGLKIVRSIELDPSNYTFNDYIRLSQSTEMMAQENKEFKSILGFFSSPALFYYAHSEKEKFKQQNITDQTFWTDAYRMLFTYLNKKVQEISEREFNESLYYKYLLELEKIISRTQMAENYLIRYCKLSRSQESFDYYVTNYKNKYEPNRLDCKDLPDLEDKYKSQFKPIRDAYFELEKETIHKVLWDGDFMTKMDAPDTSVHRVQHDFKAGLHQNLHLIFIVEKNKKREYFALKKEDNGLVLLVSKGQEKWFVEQLVSDPDYHANNFYPTDVLKFEYENHTSFIQRVADLKADEHEQQLYNSFYETTLGEKVINVVLSLVPFYSCVTSSIDGHVGEAATSCALDVLSLIPFVGVGAKYSTIVATRFVAEFEIIAAKAAMQAGARIGISHIFRAATKSVVGANSLTKTFIKDLSIATLRVVDPGFEPLTGASKFSLNQLKKLVSSRFWKGRMFASLDKFKTVVMKTHELGVPFKMVAEDFVGHPVMRYTYPQGEHFFGPKCLKFDDKVAELRSLANAPYSTYVVPVKGNENSILYRPVDFEHKELCNVFFELGDDDLLRPLLDQHVEMKINAKEVKDDMQTITVIVHQEPEVENLAGVGNWNQIKNNVEDNIVEVPKRIVDLDDADPTVLEKFQKGDILLSSEDVNYNIATFPEDIRKNQEYDFIKQSASKQRNDLKISIDKRGRKRKIKPKKYKNGGVKVADPVQKFFTANDAAEYIAKNMGKDLEESKVIVQQYQLSSMEEHRFLLTYQDFAKDYVLHKSVLPKYRNYMSKHILKFSPWIVSEYKVFFPGQNYKQMRRSLNKLTNNKFKRIYGFDLRSAERLYKTELNQNVNFFDFALLLLFKDKGWSVIKRNTGIRRHTQIAMDKLILSQINDPKMLEPVELCFQEIRKSEDVVNLLRNIERKTFSFNDITILKKYDSKILNVESTSLQTEVVYRMTLNNQFGVLDFNYVHPDIKDEYVVFPYFYFTVTETKYLNKHLLEISMKSNILLKDDWKLSRIQKLELLYDIEKTLPRGQSILKDAEAVAAEVSLSSERAAFEKLFKPVEFEDDLSDLGMIVYENLEVKNNVKDDILSSSKRVAEVDEDFPTNARKIQVLDSGAVSKNQADNIATSAEEMKKRFEYDLSMQGTSKQRKDLEVSVGEDVRNTIDKKLEGKNIKKEIVVFSREKEAFTAIDALNYIARETNIGIDYANQIVRNYLLSSLEKDPLMLTYLDFAKDYVLHGSVLKKYISFRVKHVSDVTPFINRENKIVHSVKPDFLEVSNSIRELYGSDFEKIYRVDFSDAENYYKSNSNPKLGFFDFCHILALDRNGLSVIKQKEVMMKQTQIALNNLILRHINDAEMLNSVELCFLEISNSQKIVNFLKDLQKKSFSFNGITIVKKVDLDLFDFGVISKSFPRETMIVYKMKLVNQFGVLSLGYAHPDFRNKYIVYPELQFTVTKTEKVNENLLVMNMEQQIILKNEWKNNKMRELDTLFGKEELQVRRHESDIFLEIEKLTSRGQSIVKAAELVASNVPLITEKMAIEKLKSYLLNTGETELILPTYQSLAKSWVNDLEISRYYEQWKIKNTKVTDAVLMKRNFNDKRDVKLLYDKMKIIYEPYESTLKEIHDKYVSSDILGSEVKFDDYVALYFYENNVIPRSENLLRRRNIAVINVALRQSEKSLATDSNTLYFASDFQLAPSQLKEAMKKNQVFQWNTFIELSNSLNKEKRKISQVVDSSIKILFVVKLGDRFGVANLGFVLQNKLGKHVIYPSMRFVVDRVSEEIEKGMKVMIVDIHDFQTAKETKILELVDEYEKLDV